MAFRLPRPLASEELYQYALGLLSRRDHSSAEMRTKLKRRAALADDIEPTITRLEEVGFLNDRRFATSFADVRKQSGVVGKQRVLRDLAVKRVPNEMAVEITTDAYADTDEVALVTGYIERKFRGKDLPVYLAEPKHLQSAYRRLRLAGFSSQTTIKVLKRFAAGPESLDSLEDVDEEST